MRAVRWWPPLLQYACGTAVLIAAGVALAAVAGFAHPDRADLPVMVAYLMLGSAMFVALLLQTVRIRAVPLLRGPGGAWRPSSCCTTGAWWCRS